MPVPKGVFISALALVLCFHAVNAGICDRCATSSDCPDGELCSPDIFLTRLGDTGNVCMPGLQSAPCSSDSDCAGGQKCNDTGSQGGSTEAKALSVGGKPIVTNNNKKYCPAAYRKTKVKLTGGILCVPNFAADCGLTSIGPTCVTKNCMLVRVAFVVTAPFCSCPAKGEVVSNPANPAPAENETATAEPGDDGGKSCVDQSWLYRQGYMQHEMVHRHAVQSAVFCPTSILLPCGTAHHAVEFGGRLKSYAGLCSSGKVACHKKLMRVNSLWTHHRDAVSGIAVENGITLFMHDVRFPLKAQHVIHVVMSFFRRLGTLLRLLRPNIVRSEFASTILGEHV